MCLLSGLVHGALGFGFPLVATPLVALVIDMKSAITLLAPVTLALVVISALRGGSLRDLVRRYWFMPVGIALGAWLGTKVLLAAPPEPFMLVLALVLLFYLNLRSRWAAAQSATVQRLRAPFGFAFAFLAGVCEAIANVAGPILFVYFMLLGAAPSQVVQTLNMCFTVGKGSQVLTLAAAGALSARPGRGGRPDLPSVAALVAGMRVRDRIDAQTYRAWLRKALWVMVVLLLLQFSRSVLAAEPLFAAIARSSGIDCASARQRNRMWMRATPMATRRCTVRSRPACGAWRSRCSPRAPTRRRAPGTAKPRCTSPTLHPEPEFADLLLAAKADPRAQNADGESPLHWAALSGHIVVAQRLLARGADARLKSRKGFRPRAITRAAKATPRSPGC